MFIAWTTVTAREDADKLAAAAVAEGWAVCVQVDGPVSSHYRWEGRQECSKEFRLSFKCLPEKAVGLEAFVLKHHPYVVPEWLMVPSERVGEKYLSWARTTSSNHPF